MPNEVSGVIPIDFELNKVLDGLEMESCFKRMGSMEEALKTGVGGKHKEGIQA